MDTLGGTIANKLSGKCFHEELLFTISKRDNLEFATSDIVESGNVNIFKSRIDRHLRLIS